jgi:excisionase family DNA binding protein
VNRVGIFDFFDNFVLIDYNALITVKINTMLNPHQNLDPLATIAQAIHAGLFTDKVLPAIRRQEASPAKTVYTILREVLHSQGRSVRLQLMQHLLEIESAQTGVVLTQSTTGKSGADLISTEDAAKLLGMSRPYVAMLIDQGQIQGAIKTIGGHRRIARSAVLVWKNQHQNAPLSKPERFALLRTQGVEDGIYATPEKKALSRIQALRKGTHRTLKTKSQVSSKSKARTHEQKA